MTRQALSARKKMDAAQSLKYTDMRALAQHAGNRFPDTCFFLCSDKRMPHITGSELFCYCSKAPGILDKYHTQHIAVLGPGNAAWISSFFSVISAGRVIVPLHDGMRVQELKECIQQADCGILLYDSSRTETAEAISKEIRGLQVIEIHDFLRTIREAKETSLPELKPDAVVLVATVKALKYNGGVPKTELGTENLEALKKGIENLGKHIENIQSYGLPVVVALNAFVSDTDAEIGFIRDYCASKDCRMSVARVWEKGGEGGTELAQILIDTIEEGKADFKTAYPDDMPIREKIETIAGRIYGADGVEFSSEAVKQIRKIEDMGFGNLPVCMAKTQYSLSDDPSLLGRPSGFRMHVREVYVSSGAGFVVVLTGSIMTMPGLSKTPAAYNIDVDDNGKITGLF